MVLLSYLNSGQGGPHYSDVSSIFDSLCYVKVIPSSVTAGFWILRKAGRLLVFDLRK